MLRKRAAKGKPTPALDEMPDLNSDLVLVWEIFSNLHSQRGKKSIIAPIPGGGLSVFLEPEAISMHDLKSILDLYQVYGELAIEVMNLVLRLDAKFIEWKSKKRSEVQKDNKDGEEK